MNMRPILSFPTPKATWMPRRSRRIRSPLDLMTALAVAAVLAAALFLLS
jgi:hypothetical protein